MSSSSGVKPVFFDRGGKRWPRARRWVVLAGLLVFVASVFFVQSLLIPPALFLPLKLKKLKEQLRSLQRQKPPVTSMAAANDAALQAFYSSPRGQLRKGLLNSQLNPTKPRPPHAGREIRLGYYVGWDASSFESLAAHADKLTHVCPEWFSITTPDGEIAGENDVPLLEFMAANSQLTLLPLLTNVAGEGRVPEAVENLARASAEVQGRFVDNLKRKLVEIHAGGVLIDWEGIDPATEEALTNLLIKTADGLHDAGLQLWLQVPPGEERQVYDLPTLGDSVDFFVGSLHDEVSEEDPPNAIAAQNWFAGWLDAVASHGDPQQWVIGLGNAMVTTGPRTPAPRTGAAGTGRIPSPSPTP